MESAYCIDIRGAIFVPTDKIFGFISSVLVTSVDRVLKLNAIVSTINLARRTKNILQSRKIHEREGIDIYV